MSSNVDEETLQALQDQLDVPVDILQAVAASEEFGVVVEKISSYVSAKNERIAEYEVTVKEFTQNNDDVAQKLGKNLLLFANRWI